jgi:hypothetical protein
LSVKLQAAVHRHEIFRLFIDETTTSEIEVTKDV